MLCRENCKYGYDALLPETRKTSRLHFPLRKSLKIDKVNNRDFYKIVRVLLFFMRSFDLASIDMTWDRC